MTDYNELIELLNAKLEEFQYVRDIEILIPNVRYIAHVNSEALLKVKNLCTVIEMPDNLIDYDTASDYFAYLKNSLLKRYGNALLWKELEMFFVVLCNSELYELWENDQGNVVSHASFSLSALMGVCFINKVNFNTFAVSNWGLHFSGDHFKAINNIVMQWCKKRNREHEAVKSSQLAKFAPTWEQTESVEVRLGVRDEFGRLGEYTATFLVKNDNGEEWKESIKILEDRWGYVFFPADFTKGISSLDDPEEHPKSGAYNWECMVEGKIVETGKFTISTDKTVNDTLQVYREK